MKETESQIWELLEEVKDPEIPFISLVDLGVISSVKILENNQVEVRMTPTFVGCPAIDYMQKDIQETIEKAGFEDVTVIIDMKTPWNTNKVTEKGLKQLEKFGLSAPKRHCGTISDEDLMNAPCPNCKSENTDLISPFGPTLCRALFMCNNCNQSFEQF
ncbi:MAG: phenylacetate-CoA oxygenase subunit PaaJ, partial [Chitinophagaceae bacterium]